MAFVSSKSFWKERMVNMAKVLLLKIPKIKSYVENVRMLRENLRDKDNELNNLQILIARSRSPGLFTHENDFATERLMAHPVKSSNFSVKLVSHGPEMKENRVRVAERLLAAYHLAQNNAANAQVQSEGEDLWTALLRSELSETIKIMEKGSAESVAYHLMGFGKNYSWFGGISTSIDGYNCNLNPDQIALTYLDKLVCLAESIGVLSLENPESGPWGENLTTDIDTMINEIELELRINIAPPLGIIHTDGISTRKGIFHYRHLNALYMAMRINSINPSKDAVAEIGGGLGLTAMYAYRFGCKSYTIFDLPITCTFIGHYLIHALGEDKVTLYGEPYTGKGVRVLPYWEFYNAPSKSVAVTISQDSLPEISDNLVFGYLEETKRITKDYFLSINHEVFSPRTVHNFAKNIKNLHALYRLKSWLREGYVEECYKIQ